MSGPEAAGAGAERDWDARMKTVWFELRRRAHEKLARYTRDELYEAARAADMVYETFRARSNALRAENASDGPRPGGGFEAFVHSMSSLAVSLEARSLLYGVDPTSGWDPTRQTFEDMLRLLAEARAA